VAQKAIATILMLSTFVIAGINAAAAQNNDAGGGGLRGLGSGSPDGGGFRGRGFDRRGPPVIVGGFIGDYGVGYGASGYGGNGGYGDWYGISSGHTVCTNFTQHVKTPDGWRVQVVPVC
jgi:hypothetical protein